MIKRFVKLFTNFYINILIILMAMVIVSCSYYLGKLEIMDIAPIIIGVAIIFLCFFTIKNKKISNRWKLSIILFLGFILRGLWLLNINSSPTSDFRVIYEVAGSLLEGDVGAFWGNGYIARFPHLTIMSLYMSFMIKVFPVNNLIAMKIFNLLFGVLTIYLIYLLAKEIFKSKKLGLCAASIATIFPPLVTYVGVYCTENIAIPFYLLSTYIFVLVVKKKVNKYYLILSGIILSFGNLFRMVATIMLIAFAMYIIIYTNDKLPEKIKKLALYLIPYFLVLITVSFSLQSLRVTEFPLWKGSEPKITSILKGSNLESWGRWNEEDASIVKNNNYDYELIEEESKKIIIERLTTTHPLKLAGFYLVKFVNQWNEGDFGGSFWTKLYVPEEEIIMDVDIKVLEIFYICTLILVFLGLINRRKNNSDSEINLIYLILCGYGVMCLITESQARYSLIIAWAFIILAIEGIRFLLRKSNREDTFEKI